MSQYLDETLRSLLMGLQQLVKEATLLIKLERESRWPGTKDEK